MASTTKCCLLHYCIDYKNHGTVKMICDWSKRNNTIRWNYIWTKYCITFLGIFITKYVQICEPIRCIQQNGLCQLLARYIYVWFLWNISCIKINHRYHKHTFDALHCNIVGIIWILLKLKWSVCLPKRTPPAYELACERNTIRMTVFPHHQSYTKIWAYGLNFLWLRCLHTLALTGKSSRGGSVRKNRVSA